MRNRLSRLFGLARFDSASYWESRYQQGGTSGSGSYGKLATFKADILNSFVKNHEVKRVIEFGCGDGPWPSILPTLDVTPKAISMCIERFRNDATKSFFLSPFAFADNCGVFRAELSDFRFVEVAPKPPKMDKVSRLNRSSTKTPAGEVFTRNQQEAL